MSPRFWLLGPPGTFSGAAAVITDARPSIRPVSAAPFHKFFIRMFLALVPALKRPAHNLGSIWPPWKAWTTNWLVRLRKNYTPPLPARQPETESDNREFFVVPSM